MVFADQLTRFAVGISDERVTAIAEGIATPLRVAVCGRRGVGRHTVAQALQCAGLVVTPASDADVVGYVVAEVVKPEDTAAVAALSQPVLAVLNKADLTGHAELANVAARIGAPAEPMTALWAVAALDNRLDDTLCAALGRLAAEPADLGSVDRFVTGPHRVPRQVRLRLCDTVDLSGISYLVGVLRRGGSLGQLPVLLRRRSGIDAVADRVPALGAVVHYRRLRDAVLRLEALAVSDGRIGAFLLRDDTVAAVMAAAAAVVEAAGLPVDSADEPAGQLKRAARWQRYSRGPVTPVHRACGTDIARGALRLWSPAGGPGQESA